MSRPTITVSPRSAAARWTPSIAWRTSAWRLTELTARSTAGVRTASVTSRPSSSTVSSRSGKTAAVRTFDLDPVDRREVAERGAVVEIGPVLEGCQGQRAIHEPGVDERGVQPLGEGVADRRLAGAGWTVDGDAQRHRRAARWASAATSRGRSSRHCPSRRPVSEREPIRVRTRRSTRHSTKSNRRRTSRLRPSPISTRSHEPRSSRLRSISCGGGR